MKKIVAYMIVSRIDGMALQGDVIDYMKRGWQPLGGVSIGKMNMIDNVSQAMVKYERGKLS